MPSRTALICTIIIKENKPLSLDQDRKLGPHPLLAVLLLHGVGSKKGLLAQLIPHRKPQHQPRSPCRKIFRLQTAAQLFGQQMADIQPQLPAGGLAAVDRLKGCGQPLGRKAGGF